MDHQGDKTCALSPQASVKPGVPYLEGREDACSGFICLNGGQCVSTSGQAACVCLNGYTGIMCQTVISALVKEGTCSSLPADASGNCPGYLCSNDAVCPGTQKCCQTDCSTRVCAAPVTILEQSLAQTDSANPSVCDGYCLNNGVCKETSGLATCTCTDGFTGDRCDVVQPTEKAGACPYLPANLRGQCPGTACSSDSVCLGAQKCCPTVCSTKVCAESVADASRCDTMKCPTGSTCFVVRSSADTPGQATCVLDADRTCWASGFTKAHVIPSQGQPGQMHTIPCGMSIWFGQACPRGTRCSQSTFAFPGICCINRLATNRFQNTYWARRLHIYRREAGDDPCGRCLPNQRCVKPLPLHRRDKVIKLRVKEIGRGLDFDAIHPIQVARFQ
ncbi:hypothetical protein RRG08_028422 [Elysia crispata]|uniref:Uncharacterized protein n=1 Tax=Elysia crispata TaxID=231223 RepID=A0AAE1A3V9_9GAST|nr:hypothetical protein RRG08_028422 [Elysia crispata]